jgi:O-antigen/teichoic acid export membrane protein
VADEQPTFDLRTRAIKSTGWLLTFRLGSQLISWAVSIILARFLTPADYGLFAMALTVVASIELLRELGLGAAIIQRQDLTPEHLNTIFWIVALMSTALVAALWIGAGAAAVFYAEPRLVWVLRVLGVTFLLNVIGFVPYSLLTKDIDFRRRSIAAMVGVVASSTVALTLAYLGYGVWALIIGQLVNAAIFNAALVVAARWLPGFRLSFRNIGEILKFGLRLAAVSTIGMCAPIVNRAIVGRFLGGFGLGLFTMAETLADAPHRISSAAIHQLSLPIFAKLQREEVELRRYFLTITKYLALAAIPMQIGLALVARDLVAVVLTAKWLPMVVLFQIFCVGNLFHILTLPPYPLLVARGRAGTLLKFNAVAALALVGAILAGAKGGLLAVGIAWLIAFVLSKIVLLSLSLREAGIKAPTYMRYVLPPLVATAAMSAAVLFARHVGATGSGPIQRLAFEVVLGAAVYLATLLVVDRKLIGEVRSIIQHMFVSSRA